MPGRWQRLDHVNLFKMHGIVCNKALQVVYRHTFLNQNPAAHGLTRMWADPPGRQWERVLLLDEPERLKIMTPGDQAQISLDIDAGRAGQRTWGDTVSIVSGKLYFQHMFAVCPNRLTPGGHNHSIFCRGGTGPYQALSTLNLNYAELTGVFAVIT